MNTLVDVIDQGDLCAGPALVALLLFVGGRMTRPYSRLVAWSWRGGAVAFLAYAVSGWMRFAPANAVDLFWIAIRALLAGGLATGACQIVLSIVGCAYEHTILAARRKVSDRAAAAERRASERRSREALEANRRREQERQQNVPPPVPRDPAVEAKKKSDAVRRANARFEAETLYRAHFRNSKLQEAFPPEAFAVYVQTYMGDDVDLEVIEERLRKFREFLLDLAGGPEKRTKARNPEDLTAWYEREKARLLGLPMDDTDRQMQLANLYRRYVDMMDEAMKEFHP